MTGGNEDEATRNRARARSTWPVRRASLDDDGRAELLAATSVEERLGMMWPLAVEAWRLAGRALPEYDRSTAPIRRTTLADA